MEHKDMRRQIDMELDKIAFTECMKKNVFESPKKLSHSMLRYAAMIVLTFMIGGTTVFAGYYFLNKVNVNETTLPELDEMRVVEMDSLKEEPDEYGHICTDFSDYTELQSKIGIDLLESKYATEQSYLQGSIETDQKDYAIIKMENYITGDTNNYSYLEGEDRYQYENGKIYYSPVSLSVDVILSQEQLEQGWDTDYLGFYEYVESYTSRQGYKVNLIQDTTGENVVSHYVSEKCAVFVADGIRYTLCGRTSMEMIKEIVDSME